MSKIKIEYFAGTESKAMPDMDAVKIIKKEIQV